MTSIQTNAAIILCIHLNADTTRRNEIKKTLEELWYELFSDKCSKIDTDEERELTKKALELHERANALLNREQQDAVKKHIEAFCELEALFVKKAFIKGCEFAVSFMLEAGN